MICCFNTNPADAAVIAFLSLSLVSRVLFVSRHCANPNKSCSSTSHSHTRTQVWTRGTHTFGIAIVRIQEKRQLDKERYTKRHKSHITAKSSDTYKTLSENQQPTTEQWITIYKNNWNAFANVIFIRSLLNVCWPILVICEFAFCWWTAIDEFHYVYNLSISILRNQSDRFNDICCSNESPSETELIFVKRATRIRQLEIGANQWIRASCCHSLISICEKVEHLQLRLYSYIYEKIIINCKYIWLLPVVVVYVVVGGGGCYIHLKIKFSIFDASSMRRLTCKSSNV